MSIFAKRLKEIRILRGLSQSGLAILAKLQPSAISHFETGSREPNIANLMKLADALSVGEGYLLGRSFKAVSANAEKVVDCYAKMTYSDQESFMKFGEMLANKPKTKRA